ncbi:MAG: hypothetical protein JRI61_09235, partial [Deltaproteobacteria bacterium]|nr:hypothetical protein [Deltaproteobacteria bacterium]
MKRKNFYILLDLSTEPPEEDLEKIAAAVKKKQTEWSRLLSHPSKGIQAKQFISLIPEIQKVMADPDLRKKEAMGAKKLLEKENQYKFLTIDRQLSIFLSKGAVTSREIQELVKLHSVETDEILKWMLKKEKKEEAVSRTPENKPSYKKKDKLKTIISNLGIRMRKGYVTDEEINKLANQHKVDKNEILKQIKYPVRSKNDGVPEKPKTIDLSIIKAIDMNLEIVGKSSLYEFLNLSAGSDLKTLKKNSEQKRTEILNLSKKDAEATPGSTLTGHCLTIFSNEKTRTAYDVTRARHFLATLNSDIEIAETDGVIRTEYFEAIASNAVKFGMDYEGACDYIEEYCRTKKWKTKSKKRKNRLLIIGAAAISVVLVVSIGSAVLVSVIETGRLTKEYESVIAKIKIQQELEKKKQVLTEYIRSHEKSDFTEKAEKEIQTLSNKIIMRNSRDEKDYKAALAKAADENANQNYEKSGAVYEAYLERYPNGIHADEFSKKRSEISALIDNRDFQTIKTLSKNDYEKILEACTSYLASHPKGRHRDEITILIAKMEKPYYGFLKKKI